MSERLRAFALCEKGATAIEYGLIAGLVAVACISGITAIGNTAIVQLTNIAAEFAK